MNEINKIKEALNWILKINQCAEPMTDASETNKAAKEALSALEKLEGENGDIWAEKFLDWQKSKELSEKIKKVLPHLITLREDFNPQITIDLLIEINEAFKQEISVDKPKPSSSELVREIDLYLNAGYPPIADKLLKACKTALQQNSGDDE